MSRNRAPGRGDSRTVLLVNGTGIFRNEAGALVDMQAAVSLVANGGTPSLVNLGTLHKRVSTGLATITVPLTTSGLVTTDTGTLNLTGGGTQNFGGAIYLPKANLSFSGGNGTSTSCTKIIADTLTFTGTSNVQVNCSALGTATIGGQTAQLIE